MAKPTVDTRWASDQVAISVLDKNGNSAVVLNRAEPPNQYKDVGVQPSVPVLGDAINYILYAHHEMIEWLRTKEVGTILEFEDGTMDLAQVQSDHGGTWEDLGTISRAYTGGSVTVRGFKKTA